MSFDHNEYLLIVDFGSQYTKLIARRCREFGVFSRVIPYDQPFDVKAPRGIIMSGGPSSAKDLDADLAYLDAAPCPILGICLGMHAMIQHYGGTLQSGHTQEYGKTELRVHQKGLFPAEAKRLSVWMSHGDSVRDLPLNFSVLAETETGVVAAVGNSTETRFGLQFHPEVMHTAQGDTILQHFIHHICGCASTWSIPEIQHSLVADLRQTLKSDQVILGISGGVDSAVAAALLKTAIGPQLRGIFVDTGLLRKHEATQVMSQLAALEIDVHHVDAQKRFLRALRGVSDPQRKRKIVGKTFIRVFSQAAKHFSRASWLAQGTIYPDVIESAKNAQSKASAIKAHHNVGGLPRRLPFKLVEPLRDLFKDEVRALGLALGLPESLVQRHPFPGPGLAVRILGRIKAPYIRILQDADAIFVDELNAQGLYASVDQAFAVFLPLRSVGVTGDSRRYGYTIALRAVQTKDYMTARWAPLPEEFLQTVSSRITNEIPEIARVVYDISHKPPATIEWE